MKSLKNSRGASAVEFAIVLPLLALLIFGIVELSFALYDKAVLTNACREGARAGIVHRDKSLVTDAEITSVVNNYLGNHLITFGKRPRSGTGAAVNITRSGATPGSELRVKVAYTYTFLALPNLTPGFTRGINMAAETVMRME